MEALYKSLEQAKQVVMQEEAKVYLQLVKKWFESHAATRFWWSEDEETNNHKLKGAALSRPFERLVRRI